MPSLFPPSFPPTWTVPSTFLQRRPNPATVEFPISYRFDPVSGDLARDSNGRVLLASGTETAVQAAAIAASTEHMAYPIFSRSFGAALEEALLKPTRPAVQSALETTMRAAVTRRNARVIDAIDFAFTWIGDSPTVAYTLVLSSGEHRRGEVTL